MKIFYSLFLTGLVLINSIGLFSQTPSKSWMLEDYTQDGVYGMSVTKAYTLLKNRKPKKVVVAVIDSGVDVDHEDLKDVIWKNTDEIPGNNIDDDKNGYIDDINGWNFIGGRDGKNINQDTYEITRLYVKYTKQFGNSDGSSLKGTAKKEFEIYKAIKEEIDQTVADYTQEQVTFVGLIDQMKQTIEILKTRFSLKEITQDNLQTLELAEDDTLSTNVLMLKLMFMFGGGNNDQEMLAGLQEGADYYSNALQYGYNKDFDPRNIVGDDYSNSRESGYGNNDVKGPDPSHGTHVSGIIAGKRGNGIGIDGVSDNVEIMVIRVVPDGDERDKDVANGIRYAVDNGASIINMSFGKGWAWDKSVVDDAVKYAEKKGVLIVHAAGNESEDLDINNNFPTKKYIKGGYCKTWLEIGAMGWEMSPNSVGSFSNYGKKTVDVFAPGVDIYSTIPGNEYKFENGTSMAAPSTSGVAAVLMSYFPDLKAAQIKDIIMKTSAKYPDLMVNKPGAEDQVKFNTLSVSGGVVNLYNAVQEALKVSKIK